MKKEENLQKNESYNNDNKRHGGTRNVKKKSRNSRNNRGSKHNSSNISNEYGTTNDPSWYLADPTLVRDAAALPFTRPAGQILGTLAFGNTSIPGLAVTRFIPTLGYSESYDSPINRTAATIYSNMRVVNSGSKIYEATDYMLYLLAVSQVHAYIAWMKRIYALATTYTSVNKFFPRAILLAEGIDYAEIVGNLAQFRYGLNNLINKAATLVVPNTMSIFQRHTFLVSNIFIEGESIKDQLHMFSPRGFYYFNAEKDEHGGCLEYKDLTSTTFSVDGLLKYGLDMIDRLYSDTDIAIMVADTLKAYGNNIVRLTPLDTDLTIVPIRDVVVLEQIKNMTVLGDPKVDTLDIKQNHLAGDRAHSYIVSNLQPKFIGASNNNEKSIREYMRWENDKVILTTQNPAPTPVDVMELSRLKASIEIDPVVGSREVVYGTEYICAFDVYGIVGSENIITNACNIASPCIVVTSTNVQLGIAEECSKLSHFKYHPEYTIVLAAKDNPENILGATQFWDMDNYTITNVEELKRLHEVALMSEVWVPVVAKGINPLM